MIPLTAFERENLALIIPSRAGSIDEMVTAAKLRRKIALTDAEREQIDYAGTHEAGDVRWDAAKAEELVVEFEVTDDERSLVAKGFALLAAEERLPTSESIYALYEKFNDG